MVHQITMKLISIYYENKQTKNETKHNKTKKKERNILYKK